MRLRHAVSGLKPEHGGFVLFAAADAPFDQFSSDAEAAVFIPDVEFGEFKFVLIESFQGYAPGYFTFVSGKEQETSGGEIGFIRIINGELVFLLQFTAGDFCQPGADQVSKVLFEGRLVIDYGYLVSVMGFGSFVDGDLVDLPVYAVEDIGEIGMS